MVHNESNYNNKPATKRRKKQPSRLNFPDAARQQVHV
jgi:hypothetical protein